MALIDHCIEHLPDNPRDTLLVQSPTWRTGCSRSTGVNSAFRGSGMPVNTAASTNPRRRKYFRILATQRILEVAIARAPRLRNGIDEITFASPAALHRLSDYRSGKAIIPLRRLFLHDQISRRASEQRVKVSNSNRCGVRTGRLAGLLKPALELMWVEDVRRINKFLDADVPTWRVIYLDGSGSHWLQFVNRLKTRMARTAFIAIRICNRTTNGPCASLVGGRNRRARESCPGLPRCNGDKRNSLPAVILSTGSWHAIGKCWNRLPLNLNGLRSATA